MGNLLGNALRAVSDGRARECLSRLELAVDAHDGVLSSVRRNNEAVVSYAESSISIIAGDGLTGGGDLTADRTLNVGAGTGITVAANAVSIASSYLGANPTASVGLTAVNGTATSYMRSDAAPPLDVGIVPTWTGVHTYSSQDVHNSGVSLGTSGRLNSAVADSGTNTGFLIKPTTAFTSGRFVAQVQDSAGAVFMAFHPGGVTEVGGNGSSTVDGILVVGASTAKNAGIFFAPIEFSGSGQTFFATANTVTGAYFASKPSTTVAYTNQAAGIFEASFITAASANIAESWGAWLRGQGNTGANANSTRTFTNVGGWKTFPAQVGKNFGAYTNIYGGYVSNASTAPNATGNSVTNTYGLYIEEQTRGATINNGIFLANATSGRKLIALRDQDAWIGSNAAATVTIGGTNLVVATTNIGFYSVAAIARPTTAIAAATFVANTSAIADDSATFDGYTLGQVVKALRNLGLLT